ncbi:MAG: RnfABCDGE type electron transport complex subunit D [Bacillota bacterium]|jgi:electron transport complex protein RnfD
MIQMNPQLSPRLLINAAPHITSNQSTRKIMLDVIIALMPAFVMSGVIFGSRAIIMTLLCVAFCLLFEFLFRKITKRVNTISDLSAVVTGILLAFCLPSTLPFWMAIIGCFVAIVIVKQLFGGLGQNFVNPANTARVVLLLSFSTPMTSWLIPLPHGINAVTGSTPLALLAMDKLELIPSNMEMFLGFIGGSLGETCALALLIGGVYLVIRKVVHPVIPLSFLGTITVISLLVGQDPIFHICAGGAMLCAFFIATDYTTSPVSILGRAIFGIGCGGLTMIIRLFGSYPEGVSFAVLFMNLLVPLIDNIFCKKLKRGFRE